MTTFNTTGAVQTFTVAVSGIYSLDVIGASGGGSGLSAGGKGAEQVITTYLKAGQVLSLVVGGMGSNGIEGSGGGGASDVFINSLAQLLVASGGGGGGSNFGGGVVGLDASLTTTGVNGGVNGPGIAGVGGVAGAGGTSGTYVDVSSGGGGGVVSAGAGGGGGINGGGGNNSTTFSGGVGPLGQGFGGYGGGGGGSFVFGGGGGGGGYSGGGGGADAGGGGGGGSFVATGLSITSQSIAASSSNGSVVVNLASSYIVASVPTAGVIGNITYHIGSSSTLPANGSMPWFGDQGLAGSFASATQGYFPVTTIGTGNDTNFIFMYGPNAGIEWSYLIGQGSTHAGIDPTNNPNVAYGYVVLINTTTTVSATYNGNPTNHVQVGQTVRLGATIDDGINTNFLGTTNFYSNGVFLGAGTITGNGSFVALNTSNLAVGTDLITAVYSGDAADAGSTSTAFTITVDGPSTPSNITINNLTFSNTIISGTAIFTSVAGDYCSVSLSHGSGYYGSINSLITIDNLVALSSPNLQSQGLLSNGEQILPQCNLNAGILASMINLGAGALHYEFVSGLANGSSISLTNAATITPYLTDVVVVNSLSNASATVDISSFGGLVITGKGVNVMGLTNNNHLIASGNAMYTFGAGNQTMDLVGSNAVINGGDGIDTVIMQDQTYSPIAINTTISGSTTITQVWSGQGVSTFTNVDYLKFGNQTIAIDVGVGQNAGEAYRLYQAAFNRAPDQAGLDNWITQLDKGTSIISVANAFINSAEFGSIYGSNLSNSALVNALYSNVLHRAADASGSAYWINALNNGTSRAQVLELFSESPENVGNTASLIGQGIVHQVA